MKKHVVSPATTEEMLKALGVTKKHFHEIKKLVQADYPDKPTKERKLYKGKYRYAICPRCHRGVGITVNGILSKHKLGSTKKICPRSNTKRK